LILSHPHRHSGNIMYRSFILVLTLAACNGSDDETSDTDTDITPSCTAEEDGDGDGVCVPEDCDDTNQNVYPGAPEIPYNNRDDDCDGADLTDVDGDGFEGGADGDDCMDSNPNVYPGAFEPCYPDLDYNCDGIISKDDCDLDGWVRSEDCNDEEKTTFPGAPDPWYDGVDSNCDYKSDFDADLDGDDLEWQPEWPLDSWPDLIAAWDPDNPGKLKYFEVADLTETAWYDHGQDCADNEPLIGGRLDELWDGVDRNCDTVVDALHQNDSMTAWNGNTGAGSIGGTRPGDGALGTATAYLGDLDGDGYAEVAVSDLLADSYFGRVYVLSAAEETGKAYERAGSSIDDLSGEGQVLGWDIAPAGDLNGDGKSELLVGNPIYENGSTLVYDGADLLSGAALGFSDAMAVLTSGEYAGMTTTPLGDMTGDGVPEVLSTGNSWRGLSVSVYSGADVADAGGKVLSTGDAEAVLADSSRVGGDAVGNLDITGDGATDLLFTSLAVVATDTGPDCSTGSSVLYWGDDSDFTGGVIVDTDSVNQMTGDACAGHSMGVINDLDEDGYGELVVADPSTDGEDSGINGGTIYILNGNDLSDGGDIASLASITIRSKIGGAWLRVEAHSADHDGDNVPDLLVGAPGLYEVWDALQGSVVPNSENHLYWMSNTLLSAGGTFSTADAEADFYHQTSGSGMGTSWAVGVLNPDDSQADLAVASPRQGSGALFLFPSAF
jgi:hypothetical protein